MPVGSAPAVTLGILIRALSPAFREGIDTKPDAAAKPISGSIVAERAGEPEPAGPMHSTTASSELVSPFARTPVALPARYARAIREGLGLVPNGLYKGSPRSTIAQET